MAESTVPEILRVNLTSSVLSLKCLGVDDVLAFEYLEAPKPEQIKASLRTLYLLQALDIKGSLTMLGTELSKFPLEPTYAKALLYAAVAGRDTEADCLSLVAVMSTENIWLPSRDEQARDRIKKKFEDGLTESGKSDHSLLVQVYRSWDERRGLPKRDVLAWCSKHLLQHRALEMARNIRGQLRSCIDQVKQRVLDDLSVDIDLPALREKRLRYCLAQAFFMNVCRRVPGSIEPGRGNVSQHCFVCVDEASVLMRLDLGQSIVSERTGMLAYTEASQPPHGLGLIRKASAVDDEAWIARHL